MGQVTSKTKVIAEQAARKVPRTSTKDKVTITQTAVEQQLEKEAASIRREYESVLKNYDAIRYQISSKESSSSASGLSGSHASNTNNNSLLLNTIQNRKQRETEAQDQKNSNLLSITDIHEIFAMNNLSKELPSRLKLEQHGDNVKQMLKYMNIYETHGSSENGFYASWYGVKPPQGVKSKADRLLEMDRELQERDRMV
ncbi:hypothetical protein MIR68_007922 [Amoeboaphelidium protococcarum]|nr:hypothetical protein MIR68_007922 [Amoeboaphelidium protococcarum]